MKILAASLCLGGAVLSVAQTRNSFYDCQSFSGVTISNVGLTYTVTLAVAPNVTYNSVAYEITDLFGFWALSDDDDLTGGTTSFSVWGADASNSGPGGIIGWKTNPNTGITPGGTQSFTFDSLDLSKVERFGFHARFSSNFAPAGGNTAYVTAVPEPGTIAAVGLGIAALMRRRRK